MIMLLVSDKSAYTNAMKSIVLIVHDIRSCHNVGSLLRTAEGLGVDTVYITGYSPYPAAADDTRLPHIREKLTKQIQKTALGAEVTQSWKHHEDIHALLDELQEKDYTLCALEQSTTSLLLPDYQPENDAIALLIGREVEGLDEALLKRCDVSLEIPMFGSKESFNVVQATAMALYQIRFR